MHSPNHRIHQAFAAAKKRGEAALIPYITGGYCTSQDTPGNLLAMQRGGADIIELGIPCDNPYADGPTIANAHKTAVQNGTRGIKPCLGYISTARAMGLTVPVILMGYSGDFDQYDGGLDQFCQDAAASGLDGVLAVGVPFRMEIDFNTMCFENGLSFIALVFPDDNEERIEDLVNMSSTFIYVVSAKGKTGMRDTLPEGLNERVSQVRSKTSLPLVIGFGISNPSMVQGVADLSDGVVVGSFLTSTLEKGAGTGSTTEDRAKILQDNVSILNTGTAQSDTASNQASQFSQVPPYLESESLMKSLRAKNHWKLVRNVFKAIQLC